tara:strand:+ start:525 stop:1685 length:1161 start_codon:yes stop_codon:yes gene_type:complete
MKMRKICVVSGTRADYGLLRYLLGDIKKEKKLDLQIIATAMHLSPEFGLTYREIEKDGFSINQKIEMLLSSDTPSSISKSTGLGIISFAEVFKSLKPDIIVVLGDRFEIFSACIAALYSRIPIAHIHGGETTEGAFDEAIRHSITKMAWWHFVAAEDYRKRVIQMGESPQRVFNVGGLGVDAIKKTKLLSKNELKNKLGINFGEKNLLITFHPITLEKNTSRKHLNALLSVLENLDNTYLIFTMPNADSDGRIIGKLILDFVKKNKTRSISFTSMGHKNYISTLQFVDGVVGNSSSGIAEVPSFKIGTVNIGDRQNGRLKAKSIIDCKPNENSIKDAIMMLYDPEFQKKLLKVENPYGKGLATDNILSILLNSHIPQELKKPFYDL